MLKQKKIKILFMFLIILFIILDKSQVSAYTIINSNTLFEESIFNTLELNYKTLPTVTVSGSYSNYSIYDGETVSGTTTARQIWFYDCTSGDTLDATVTAFFSNCGILGR